MLGERWIIWVRYIEPMWCIRACGKFTRGVNSPTRGGYAALAVVGLHFAFYAHLSRLYLISVSSMDYKLIPYFQPIIETASGRIAGYEVLARRIDESGNLVSAGPLFSDRSIPLKERLRMDRDLRFVAINRFKQFDDDLFLSINISPE